ncbi:hypothetical protein BKA60DRAFT_588791, partial [Fusarium oxysporum]
MSFWTLVSISDDVATKIISLYLETDHPLLGIFEPDLLCNLEISGVVSPTAMIAAKIAAQCTYPGSCMLPISHKICRITYIIFVRARSGSRLKSIPIQTDSES